MLAAYCWPQSALPQETIQLYCHSSEGACQLEVVRQGATDTAVLVDHQIPCQEQQHAENIGSAGCDWQPSYTLAIPSSWCSGFYLARLTSQRGNTTEAFFVVRAIQPAGALLVLSTSTWNAYNTWGGPSLYTGGKVVSPMRPLPPGFLAKMDPHQHRLARYKNFSQSDAQTFAAAGYDMWSMAAGWANWELLFVRWAETQGYQLDYAVSEDLDKDPNLLAGYSTYLSIGHDEYWSAGMRDTVETWVDAGGRAAFFSGNTAFWQVRFSDSYRQMTGYKFDFQDDPLYLSAPAETNLLPGLSTMWSDPLVGRPENTMTGVSFSRGGYAQMPNSPTGTGGYTVWQPEHWIFASTGLQAGDTLGAANLVVGYECDGCALTMVNERPVPTGEDGTSLSFEIVATAPARLWETEQLPSNLDASYVGELNWVAERIGGKDSMANRERFDQGYAVLGTYKRGKGEVFTTGCTDWAYGLGDRQVATVTQNVLQRFGVARKP